MAAEPAILLSMLAFLIVFGIVLYLITHFFVQKWKEQEIKPRTISLWLWRLTLVIIIVFVSLLFYLNRLFLFSMVGLYQLMIFMFILVVFVSLIEIAVIDLLLPDVVKLWKRVLIEGISFLMLVGTTLAIFSVYALYGGA